MIYMLSHDDRCYFSLHCRLPLRHPRLLPAGIIRILTVVSYILPLVVCVMPIVFWSAALFQRLCRPGSTFIWLAWYKRWHKRPPAVQSNIPKRNLKACEYCFVPGRSRSCIHFGKKTRNSLPKCGGFGVFCLFLGVLWRKIGHFFAKVWCECQESIAKHL